jgi:hypothetical protein
MALATSLDALPLYLRAMCELPYGPLWVRTHGTGASSDLNPPRPSGASQRGRQGRRADFVDLRREGFTSLIKVRYAMPENDGNRTIGARDREAIDAPS